MEAVKVLSEKNKTVYKDLKCWGPKMRIMVYYALKTCYDEDFAASGIHRDEPPGLV